MLPIHTILHPTDFSKPSEDAFRLAASLARDYGAQLIVFHVAPPASVYGQVAVKIEAEDFHAKLWEEFRGLEKLDPRIRAVDLKSEIEEGDAVPAILRKAEGTGCDLIIMATHGRTGVGRLLMGSVAEQVLRRAPCPVLTVKSPLPEAHVAEEAAPELVEAVKG
jgi:nucleotide-binding universal stress UspA family protein